MIDARLVFWIRIVLVERYAASRLGAPNDRLARPGPVVAIATVATAAAGCTRPAPAIRGS